jgi:hypothetical protein
LANLYAIVQRGTNKGIQIYPHRFANGKYRLAKDYDSRKKYIEVDLHEIPSCLERGLRLWMSNPGEKHPPGLVRRAAIHGFRS